MNLLKRRWQKRWVRRLAWSVVTILTFYALLCAAMNWSGARRWRATQAMLKQEGETLDFREIMNEPVPEAENFCAIPLLKDLALVVDNDTDQGAPGEKRKRLKALWLLELGPRPKFTNASLARRTDFKVWADLLRKEGSLPMPPDSGDSARDVLAALAKHDAVVKELAAGLNRPHAQWTPEWKTRELPPLLLNIALPHYSAALGLIRTLDLRAIAAARAGDAAKAQESALIIARLNQACLNDPFLIGLLSGISGTVLLHDTTWELCEAHAGTAEDFARLESAIADLDIPRAALRAWRSELAEMVDTVQGFKIRRDQSLSSFVTLIDKLSDDAGSPINAGDVLMRALPSGLFDANSAVLADLEFRHLIKPLKGNGWWQAFAAGRDLDNEMRAMKHAGWRHPSNFMALLAVPVATREMRRYAYTQVLVNQAVVACALERYRIKKGSYPDSLETVTRADGKPLPLDVLNKKPMHYRKTDDGKYALWCEGFDGNDDGGKRVLDERGGELRYFQEINYTGDWVWDFPAK